MRFAFIAARMGQLTIAWMCRRMRVSRAGFYRWRTHPGPARTKRDQRLGTTIRALYEASRGTYGSPRITAALKAQGEAVGRKRVARLLRENGLAGRPRATNGLKV